VAPVLKLLGEKIPRGMLESIRDLKAIDTGCASVAKTSFGINKGSKPARLMCGITLNIVTDILLDSQG
jgi:hypothetical protein